VERLPRPAVLEFSLPVRFDVKERGGRAGPIPPEDIVVGDVSGLHEGGWLKVEIGGTDTGGDMSEAVEEKAFPHVFKARHGRDEDPTDDELREAVRAELDTLVRASWRREHGGVATTPRADWPPRWTPPSASSDVGASWPLRSRPQSQGATVEGESADDPGDPT
jgi:hypothetical protein